MIKSKAKRLEVNKKRKQIIKLHETGDFTLREIGKMLGVSYTYAWFVIQGRYPVDKTLDSE
jgi:DNA-directed RNA polymerase specialized sigma subunit